MAVIDAESRFQAIRTKVRQINQQQSLIERGLLYGDSAYSRLRMLQSELIELRASGA
jgi:hypothetical protein